MRQSDTTRLELWVGSVIFWQNLLLFTQRTKWPRHSQLSRKCARKLKWRMGRDRHVSNPRWIWSWKGSTKSEKMWRVSFGNITFWACLSGTAFFLLTWPAIQIREDRKRLESLEKKLQSEGPDIDFTIENYEGLLTRTFNDIRRSPPFEVDKRLFATSSFKE